MAKLTDDEKLKRIWWVVEMRNDIIEECARVAEDHRNSTRELIAAAIRALKEKV